MVTRQLVFILAAMGAMASTLGAAEFKVGGKTFTVPDGLTVEQVTTTDLVPRPIVADFDERGRLYVADSSGSSDKVEKQLAEKPHRVVRLEDTNGDGVFDKSITFADKMMFPEGAMWLDGSLYVSAPPSIWKLTDTDDDGVADQRVEWFQGKTLTGCANDLHGPYAGPDGWVYWCKGAFAEQKYTLPNGKPFVTRASHVFRARPDGTGVEPVMTGGMDNPVDVVFTPGGERVFSCTFLQHPAGGRRDGLIHAVYGGVYGKVHDVLEGHPRTGPDVMPVLSHLGPAAPCGLTRYEADFLGPEYRDNLFCTLFNMHKVTRHVLTPDGATFKSRDEDFLVSDSLDFHPTDVLEDADGSLLVVDTGGWYKLCCPTSQLHKPDVLGAIYRIRRTNAPKVQDPRGLKLPWEKMTADQAAGLLDDPRPAVRRRAIQTLARLGRPALPAIERAMAPSASHLSRLNAVWAATRIDGPQARSAVRKALKDTSETVRQAAAHSVSAWRDREAAVDIMQLLASDSAQNRRVAAEAIGRIGDAGSMNAVYEALSGPVVDRTLFHSLTYALIEINNPAAALAKGLARGTPAAKHAALVAADQSGAPDRTGPDLRIHLTEAMLSRDAALRDSAAWIAARHPEQADAMADVYRFVMSVGDSNDPQRRAELAQWLAAAAKSPAIQNLLAERLTDRNADERERQIVLAAMARAGLKETPKPWLDAVASVLTSGGRLLRTEAVAAASRLATNKEAAASLAGPLRQVAARIDVLPATRVEALAAIPGDSLTLAPDAFDFLLSQLLPDRPASVRVMAADVLGRARLTPDQLAALVDAVKVAGPLEIGRLLAAYEKCSDDAVGTKLVAALKDAKAAKALRADMVKPRLAKFSPRVQKEAEPLLAALSPDAAAQAKQLDEMLSGLPAGDVRRGQAIFHSQKTACATCHAIGYLGGTIGPDLTRIGAVRADRDLLESIVFPSASFVQSYEPVLVDTASGDRQSGIVRKNDADEVVLITGPTQEVRVPRKDVKEMRPGTVSVMPSGLDQQLSNQELADLLAFLKACK